MSTRKDGVKASKATVTKKKVANVKPASSRNVLEAPPDSRVAKKAEKPKIAAKTTTLESTNDFVLKKRISATKTLEKVAKPLLAQPTTVSSSSKVTKVVKKPTKPTGVGTTNSSRILKTEFFPSKNLYTNALKKVVEPPKKVATKPNTTNRIVANKTKKMTRSKPHPKLEEAQIHDASSDTSSMSERPRTATLKRGSIVNHNIVGPDAPVALLVPIISNLAASKTLDDEEDNYDDDFESYDSDFEAYSSSDSTSNNLINLSQEDTSSSTTSSISSTRTSPVELIKSKRVNSAETDEEKTLDSGNFELPSDYKHKQILDNINESMEKENAKTSEDYNRNNPASLSDEGFEEAKSLQYINFLGAKQKFQHRKSLQLKKKRGEEILSMIRLDTFNCVLFDLAPVPYEVFIKSFGKSNTIQVSVQTGEDNVDEEIQTEEIPTGNKWTQYPAVFSTKVEATHPKFWEIYKNDYLGVGSDAAASEEIGNVQLKFNENHLNKFLLSAGNLILRILEESGGGVAENLLKNPREIPFSDGYVVLNTESKSILQNCSIQHVSFACDDTKTILTTHVKKNLEDFNSTGDYRSVICLWDMSNSEEPKKILTSYGEITCCSFGLSASDLVFGGLQDGTISIWNVGENSGESIENLQAFSPIYTSDIELGHFFKIVAVQPFQDSVEQILQFEINESKAVISLDEDGELISWGIYTKGQKTSPNWGEISLIKNSRFSLKQIHPELKELQCTDFAINKLNTNCVYISTNYGFIIHHLLNGARSNVKKFSPETRVDCKCLETCQFSQNYFLAGFSDGNVCLYSRLVEKPLMVLSHEENNRNNGNVQIIQWSRTRPFVFYTKDKNNTIHIWDLKESDMYPMYSIPYKETITCMGLSPLWKNESDHQKEKSFMLIGTYEGLLYLHLLSPGHGVQEREVYDQHESTFLNYVNRL